MLSAPIVITAPTAEVIDLDAVKTFLRVDGDDLDVEIAGYMAAAIAEIEQTTGTRLAPQTVEVRADSFADLLHLTVGPVTGVVSIRYRGFDGAEQTVDPEDYELIAAALDASIVEAYLSSWPAIPRRDGIVRVQLQVGYGEVPADIRLALLLSIRAKFDGTACDLFALTCNHRIWM